MTKLEKQIQKIFKNNRSDWDLYSVTTKGDEIQALFILEQDIYDGSPDAPVFDTDEDVLVEEFDSDVLNWGDAVQGLPLEKDYKIELSGVDINRDILTAEAEVTFTKQSATPKQLKSIEQLKQKVLEEGDIDLYNQLKMLADSLGIEELFTLQELQNALWNILGKTDGSISSGNKMWKGIRFIVGLNPKLKDTILKGWLLDVFEQAYKYNDQEDIQDAHEINKVLKVIEIDDISEFIFNNLVKMFKDELVGRDSYQIQSTDGLTLIVTLDDDGDEDTVFDEFENELEFLVDDVYSQYVNYDLFIGVEKDDGEYVLGVDVSDMELNY